ncbi:MAG: hypothetical protein NTV69_10550, partial [Caldilinea sp.]|nr:hypothetical protein [Caldilinea sp.]
MSKIRTVLGDIDPPALGVTYMHEHVITHPPASFLDRDLAMESIAAATRELSHFHAAGGRSLVEMTPRDYGRDPLALREIATATGVQIICTTGWLKDKLCRPLVAERTVADLADEMIREITVGIDETGVRAGVIKAASSLNTITPAEEKVFRAAARAHLGTLDRVTRVVRLGVYLATSGEFTEHPHVADAASELFENVFGKA